MQYDSSYDSCKRHSCRKFIDVVQVFKYHTMDCAEFNISARACASAAILIAYVRRCRRIRSVIRWAIGVAIEPVATEFFAFHAFGMKEQENKCCLRLRGIKDSQRMRGVAKKPMRKKWPTSVAIYFADQKWNYIAHILETNMLGTYCRC